MKEELKSVIHLQNIDQDEKEGIMVGVRLKVLQSLRYMLLWKVRAKKIEKNSSKGYLGTPLWPEGHLRA